MCNEHPFEKQITMKNKMLKTFIVAMLCCPMVYGQQNERIKALSIFKNGQSFVIKESSAKTVDGTYMLSQLPNALFATYWFAGEELY